MDPNRQPADTAVSWPSTKDAASASQAPSTDGALPTISHWPPLPVEETGLPVEGNRLGDFELLRELGRGSFARVFLARQTTLDRLVALKVSANATDEGRTLASLDHPHIVQVFDETVDRARGLRLLSMRYVPGVTLHNLLQDLTRVPLVRRSGRHLLEILARREGAAANVGDAGPLDGLDYLEVVCWIGARLAEALAFAHQLGILHRDLKPANILLDRLGRPLLLDFNLSFDPRRAAAETSVGGTPAYMAPEHWAAFEGRLPANAVDERADVFALGVILYELLTGQRPAVGPGHRGNSPAQLEPAIPGPLDRVVRRCLEPEPARRYPSAAELARALEGCREWSRTQKDLPPPGPLVRAAIAHPVALTVALPGLPHLIGSTGGLLYNALWLATQESTVRWTNLFVGVALTYTVLALGVTAWTAWRLGGPQWRTWRDWDPGDADAQTLTRRRQEALRIPELALWLAVGSWTPGCLLVPLTLAVAVGPAVGLHLALAYLLAGVMSLTYSVYATVFLVLRVGYPGLWGDAQGLWQTARLELAGMPRKLRRLQLLAGLLPLSACALLLAARIGTHPTSGLTVSGHGVFEGGLLVLILLGMGGSGLTFLVHDYLQRTLAALTGVARP